MDGPQKVHASHETKISFDSSVHDEFCVNCNAADDALTGKIGRLADPCPKPVGKGGITVAEWEAQRRQLH